MGDYLQLRRPPPAMVAPRAAPSTAGTAPALQDTHQALNGSPRVQSLLALQRKLNPVAAPPVAQGPVLQRYLTGDEAAGVKIKLWSDDDDEIQEAYLAEPWAEGDEMVRYTLEKPDGKKKSKQKVYSIAARFAFPGGMKDGQVKVEIAQVKEADAAQEGSAHGELDIPKTVVAYLLQLVNANKEEYELDDQPTSERIILMISSDQFLAQQFLKGHASTLAEIKEMIEGAEDYYIPMIMGLMVGSGARRDMPVSSQSSQGSGGSDEWKTDKTARLKGELLKAIADHESFGIIAEDSTLHHKMSRSHIKKMLKLLGESGGQDGVGAMQTVIAKIKALAGGNDNETALENWTANIELGVLANKRKKGDDPAENDDPGEGFDGSYLDGTATPRTEKLQEVDLQISGATKGEDVDWEEVAGLLEQTLSEHATLIATQSQIGGKKRGNEHFTDPHLEMWTEDDGTFTRGKEA